MGHIKSITNTNIYKYTDGLRVSYKDNLVILASEESREWIKISEECFNILNRVLDMNLNYDEILECFELEKDKKYFGELIKCLCDSKILINKKHVMNRRIESVCLIVTNRCNLSCNHCCADATDLNTKDELDTEDMIKVLDKILQINPENITISGGEPLVRSDLWVLMDYLKNKFNGTIDIMTNGLLIDENNINNIKLYFNSVSISIDGVDEESCKIIRGHNVYENVIKKVELLKSNDFNRISLSAVLPNNEYISREFEKLNKNLGTESVIRHFSYQGRAEKNHKKIEEQMNRYLRDRNMEEKNIIDWKSYIPIDRKDIRTGACGGCETTVSIGSKGELYPCNLLMNSNYNIGNILEIDDIVDYISDMNIDTNKGYKSFIDIKLCNYKKCKECSVKSFCWSCPAEYEDFLNKDEIFDERCSQIRDALISVIWR
nr:radical SAM protein [Clostridioides sp.]